MSCMHSGDSFSVLGFFLAALSNFGFSSRAVLTKCMNLAYPDAMDGTWWLCNIIVNRAWWL